MAHMHAPPRSFPQDVVRTILNVLYKEAGSRLSHRYALVSKDWFRASLPLYWRVADHPLRILTAITGKSKLGEDPTPEDWLHFESCYAPHVQELVLTPRSRLELWHAQKLFHLLSTRYPGALPVFPGLFPLPKRPMGKSRDIFPNLRSIRVARFSTIYEPEMALILSRLTVIASHAGVVRFSVEDSERRLRRRNIALKYTDQGFSVYRGGKIEVHIRDFVVFGPRRYEKVVQILGYAFARTSASCIYLPQSKLTSNPPKTRHGTSHIIFSHTVRPYNEGLGQAYRQNLPVWSKAFSLLERLELKEIGFREALQLFNRLLHDWNQEPSPHSRLKRIELTLQYPESNLRTEYVTRKLFKAIAVCAPRLEVLQIHIMPDTDPGSNFLSANEVMNPGGPYAVTLDTLSPLRSMNALRKFEYLDVYPPLIDRRSACHLGTAWPSLQELVLGLSSPVCLYWWNAKEEEWNGNGSRDNMYRIRIQFADLAP